MGKGGGGGGGACGSGGDGGVWAVEGGVVGGGAGKIEEDILCALAEGGDGGEGEDLMGLDEEQVRRGELKHRVLLGCQ